MEDLERSLLHLVKRTQKAISVIEKNEYENTLGSLKSLVNHYGKLKSTEIDMTVPDPLIELVDEAMNPEIFVNDLKDMKKGEKENNALLKDICEMLKKNLD